MKKFSCAMLLFFSFLSVPLFAKAAAEVDRTVKTTSPIIIQEQGSFFVGGTVLTNDGDYDPVNFWNSAGQSAYADHAYVFYQIPVNQRKLPLVFLHGGGQSKKTWESTPDGREGFQNIFLRRGFSVYLVDQPRRGEAGSASVPGETRPSFFNKGWFTLSRLGEWPDFYHGTQFPQDAASLEQYYRQMTSNIGPLDFNVVSDAMAALFDKVGPAILVTHSQGGSPGWYTAVKSRNVRAIVAYEPGGSPFVFPEGEVPAPIPTSFGLIHAQGIPLADFKKLTTMPIIIYYGDNIAREPTANFGQDQWRAELQLARDFTATVNRYGGDATVVHFPEIGVTGNTHFVFSDRNNLEIAGLLSAWFAEKKLD
jgi:pimeloyl-ACP methyl ester carboxylesterase